MRVLHRINIKRIGRERVCIWLDRRVLNRIKAEAFQRKVSQQMVIESAVLDRYSEVLQETRDEATLRHYAHIRVRLKTLDRELEAVAESFGLFIRMWLSVTPRITPDEHEAALKETQERYGRFVRSLAGRLCKRATIFTELPKEIFDKEEDWF